jgi:hypothetical protein
MKILIMQSPPASLHFISGPDTLLRTLFSNPLNLCFLLGVTDQVSAPYKTNGKITVLYILICEFLERREGERRL